MGRLQDRVAIITGAKLQDGKIGIGGTIARTFVREGARVVVANRTGATAQALADELNATSPDGACAHALQVDVCNEADIARMVTTTAEVFGGVDILVNNAAETGEGLRHDWLAEHIDAATWDSIYSSTVRGPALASKYAIPHMLRRGGGVIINTSSTSSMLGDVTNIAYGSAKAALNMMSLYIATQYGRRGIRCNAVVPGLTTTANTVDMLPPEAFAMFERQVLRPRPNNPDDVANAFLFLASDEGAGVNGEIVRVDGGFIAHQPYSADLWDQMNSDSKQGAF
jgi:NAD(P)-dependent dehydrogenase (short-subunit alcohol dehydrogenase family)